jgi:ribosomal 50S subunit-recycling heat shock protein
MNIKTAFSLLAAASLAFSSAAFAAGVQDYQVTGPIAELNDTMIVVEKGTKKERFEITRDANTKASGEMKVGDKVTVHYTMTATNIEVKPAKAEKGAKKEAAKPAASPKQ